MSTDHPPNAESRVRSIGRIAFVQWTARPDGAEVREVSEALLDLRRALGVPLLIIAQFPENATVLTGSGNVEFLRYSPRVARGCECQYAVLSGAGLGRKLLRGTLTAIATMMGIPAEILEDAETAVAHACIRGGMAIDPVLAEARARGLVRPAGSSDA